MMNRAIPPDHVLNFNTDITVLERQTTRLKSHLDPFLDHPTYAAANFTGPFSSGGFFSDPPLINTGFGGFLGTAGSVEPDLFLENGWPDLRNGVGLGCGRFSNTSGSGSGFESGQVLNYEVTPVEPEAKDSVSPATYRSESFKKRKSDKVVDTKVIVTRMEKNPKEKKMRGWEEEGEEISKITEQNTVSTTNSKSITKNNKNKKENSSNDTSKDNSKVTEVQKPDYIHVRARRGQATDSHSLAERVRREKISERMKYLQDLVPGCNKITGKAGMLDEIINYVQSLQRQVEFLSMKLAAVNPRLDFNIDDIFPKEVFSSPTSSFQNVVMPSSEITSSGYLQFNPMQQVVVSCSGTETGTNPTSEMVTARRTTTACPISMPDRSVFDSQCFNNVQASSMWDSDLQDLCSNVTFDQGRSQLTTFPSQAL